MNDQISIQRVALLHPAVIQIFTDFITAAETGLGVTFRVVQGLRTFAQQQAIYNQGRTTPGAIVTNAPAGESFHNYGLAVDLSHLIDNGTGIDWHFDMSQLTQFMPDGMEWGGNWISIKDLPHFQLSFGYTWQQLLAKYNAKDFIDGTTFVNL